MLDKNIISFLLKALTRFIKSLLPDIDLYRSIQVFKQNENVNTPHEELHFVLFKTLCIVTFWIEFPVLFGLRSAFIKQ